MQKIAIAVVGAIGAFVALSFLGGSALWWALGMGDAGEIQGAATPVRDAPDHLGAGWSHYGGDAGGSRYSALGQITPTNVDRLKIAWTMSTGAFEGREAARHRSAFQTTPILVEDRLVFCTQFNDVIAIDPGSGEEIWRFDPEAPLDGRPANQFTCRGVSQWRNPDARAGEFCGLRIFTGTVEAEVIALDAATGAPCTDFGENGRVRVEPSLSLRWPGEFQITSAPSIVAGKVVVGSSIGDNLRTESPSGTVHAFDAVTGALAWSFNPVPRDPVDPARESWSGDSADRVGHANVWSTMSVDHERGLIFLPTSSASPDFYGGDRVGDNRYANSVVALRGETGEVAWSYQIVHHDVWDYDLPAQPGLYQVWRDGRTHDVVAQVTKTGHVFVLDRDTGAPFLPIVETPAPQDGAVAGETLSPTQPVPSATPMIVPDQVDPEDAFGVTFWDKNACAKLLKGLRRDGLFTPPSEQGTLLYPFTGGGANWGSAAFEPSRNLLIVNMSSLGHAIRLYRQTGDERPVSSLAHDEEYAPMEGAPYAMTRETVLSPLGLPCTPPPWGVLAAVDLASGAIVWRKTLGTTEDLANGLALKFGTPNVGGPIVTAGGVVFIGAAMDDYLRAFDVETGAELWKGRLPAGGQATPMTYEWGGAQYVVIAAGGHARLGTKSGDYIVAFKLPD